MTSTSRGKQCDSTLAKLEVTWFLLFCEALCGEVFQDINAANNGDIETMLIRQMSVLSEYTIIETCGVHIFRRLEYVPQRTGELVFSIPRFRQNLILFSLGFSSRSRIPAILSPYSAASIRFLASAFTNRRRKLRSRR